MSDTWTTQQILSLAPDPASAKAGQGLTGVNKWVSLGRNEKALWGECQGSGSNPYQVQIELSEPAFRCSCPSRKFPCKHGIALFLIFANNTAAIKEGTPPGWVAEWLSKREEKSEKKKEAAKPENEKTPEELMKAADEQAKRAAQREKKVTQGLYDLDLWLRDLARQGVAALQSKPYKFWDDPAGRLVDAQALGAARMLRDMASIPASGPGWQERLIERLGLLALLLEAYSRLELLPEKVQADVRDAIGWNVRQEAVLSGAGISDVWLVLGQRAYEEEQFKVHRTWLKGHATGRDALILNFIRKGQPMETVLATGTCLEAELAFFPGMWPLRALLKERKSAALPLTDFPAYLNSEQMLCAYANALAANPWLETLPVSIQNGIPVRQGEGWAIRDSANCLLPVSSEFTQGWKLLAVSGGHALTVMGEWDGAHLLPVSAWVQNRLIPLA